MLGGFFKSLGPGKAPASAPGDRRRSPRLIHGIECFVYDHVRFQSKGSAWIRNMGFQGVCLDTGFQLDAQADLTLQYQVAGVALKAVRGRIVWVARMERGWRSGLALEESAAGPMRQGMIELLKKYR